MQHARTLAITILALSWMPACDSDSGDDGADSATDEGTPESGDDDSPTSADDGTPDAGDDGTPDTGDDGSPTTDGDGDDDSDGDGTSGSGDDGGPIDNPCGDVSVASGDPFTLDFGAAGSFTYEGGKPVCQLAGIHTGTWDGPDSTQFSISGMSTTPLMDTAQGTEIDLFEVRWERSAGLDNGQADRFSGMGTAVVVAGGPFTVTNPGDPATLCIYDVGELSNINTGETATFPGPFAVACN